MSKSTLKSKSGHLRINFTSTIHYHYKALEFVLIIKPRVSHSVGGSWKHEGAPTLPPPSHEVFQPPPPPLPILWVFHPPSPLASKLMPPMGCPHLKMMPPEWKSTPHPTKKWSPLPGNDDWKKALKYRKLIDLANKLHDLEKFLISFYAICY